MGFSFQSANGLMGGIQFKFVRLFQTQIEKSKNMTLKKWKYGVF